MTEHLWIAASEPALAGIPAAPGKAPVSYPAARAWGEALLAEATRLSNTQHPVASGVRYRATLGSLIPADERDDAVRLLLEPSLAWIGWEPALTRICSHSGWRTMSAALVEQGFAPEMIDEAIDPSRPADQCGAADPAGVQEFLRQYMPGPLLDAVVDYFRSDATEYLRSWRPLEVAPAEAQTDRAWVVVAPPEAVIEVRHA